MPEDRDYLPILEELIGFPTVSADSNLALIDYAQSLLDEHGYVTRRLYDVGVAGKREAAGNIGPDAGHQVRLAAGRVV